MKTHIVFVAVSIIIVQLIATSTIAQSRQDSIINIRQYPVQSGYIYKYYETVGAIQDPANFITIYAPLKDVTAVSDGVIKNISEFENAYTVFIENKDSVFIYSNLEMPLLQKGTLIKKGQIIGAIKNENSKNYELIFGILIKASLVDLNYIELQKYLTKHFSFANTKSNRGKQSLIA